ncbi:hypothetical protein M0R45_022894 [Rubus argutus]|uniref:Uncharacterized protein n=1 Tax=Rubus argutus TaxID=59490 RepID=A0AAW1WN94_RUBAR
MKLTTFSTTAILCSSEPPSIRPAQSRATFEHANLHSKQLLLQSRELVLDYYFSPRRVQHNTTVATGLSNPKPRLILNCKNPRPILNCRKDRS